MLCDLRGATIGADGSLTVQDGFSAVPAIMLGGRAYVQTFSEDFRSALNVTPYGPSHWIAHTPWYGDFGDAGFADPVPGFPFQCTPNGLTITATKINGAWRSGLLCTRDPNGNGWTQAMGYFEARIRMPPGPGVWPAFWLNSKDDPNDSGEIDVIEYYGQFTTAYNVTAHTWPKPGSATRHLSFHKTVDQNTNALPDLTADYHTYGCEITSTDTIFYFDRKEVFRTPTLAPWKQPMCVLLNLALGGGWPIDQTPNPSVLFVDYVKAYRSM